MLGGLLVLLCALFVTQGVPFGFEDTEIPGKPENSETRCLHGVAVLEPYSLGLRFGTAYQP